MSQQTTIRKLAELVNTPVEKLLEQLADAGMKFSGPDQVVTSTEKVKLLGFLRRSHGKADTPAETADEAAKKITLNRRKLQEVTVSAGRSKTTVNVEVRQKRTYTKDASGKAMTPDEERADILRKLEESRQRNLDEQRALAEKDRLRDEEIARKRQEEQAEKDRVEAERKAAEAAAEAARNAPVAEAPAPAAAA
ncbi:translation initiation factor IF-2 associated domain-containing protein, partial [Stenotrophomonas sp. 278]|uniref:translation initiation factor IF-2 associated domain-containing protein n=1 Tax=Stenotrophomonas sp. 278 TaxID=2479851 RepID=UPI000FA42E8E